MRILDLPTEWTIGLDILLWLIIHFGVSKFFTSLSDQRFDSSAWFWGPFLGDGKGSFYSQFLKIHKWKKFLPDAAPWFRGGFPKKNLTSQDPAYLRKFILETRRGELAHWVTIGLVPLFFLFNSFLVSVIMVVYSFGANLPCIFVQRYNRFRLQKILRGRVHD